MEDIELKYVPVSQSNTQFCVDTKATCFLCLENILNCSNHQVDGDSLPPDKTKVKLSLFRICRYLKIKLGDNIFTQSSEMLPENFSNLLVSVCQECNSVVENLSNLLEQLEMVQMKVDCRLGKFTAILKGSEVNLDRENPPAVDSLRAQITKKCTERLSNMVPKVLISEVQHKKKSPFDDPAISHPPSPTLHAFKCELPSPSGSSPPQSEILSSSTNPSNNPHPNSPKPTSSGYRLCSLCSPSRSIYHSNYNRHKIRHHYETYFLPHKMQNLSQSDFKIYCDHVFKVELLTSQKNLTSDDLTSYHCPHCPNPIIGQQTQRTHLLSCHKQILIRKLVELQKSTTVKQIKETKLPKFALKKEDGLKPYQKNVPKNMKQNIESSFYTCDICQPSRTVSSTSKNRHIASLHLTTVFSASKIRSSTSENDFKLYCEHTFDTEIKSSQRITDQIKCDHCWNKFGDEKIYRCHLIEAHEMIMAKKLKRLQVTLDVARIREILNVPTMTENAKCSNANNRFTGLSCKHCGRVFGSRSNLKRHLMVIHNEKGDRAEVKDKRSGMVLTGIECEHCGGIFGSRFNLKRHLFKAHKVVSKKDENPNIKTGKQIESMVIGEVEDNMFDHSAEFMTKVEVPASGVCGEILGHIELMDEDEMEIRDKDPLEI